MTNGWSLEDVRSRLDEMTRDGQEPDMDPEPPQLWATDDPEYDEAAQQEAESHSED